MATPLASLAPSRLSQGGVPDIKREHLARHHEIGQVDQQPGPGPNDQIDRVVLRLPTMQRRSNLGRVWTTQEARSGLA